MKKIKQLFKAFLRKIFPPVCPITSLTLVALIQIALMAYTVTAAVTHSEISKGVVLCLGLSCIVLLFIALSREKTTERTSWLKQLWNWIFPPVRPISEQPEPEEVEDKQK